MPTTIWPGFGPPAPKLGCEEARTKFQEPIPNFAWFLEVGSWFLEFHPQMEASPSRGPKASPFRLILVGAGVLLAAVLLVEQVGRLFADRSIMPPDDFVEYWA